MPAYTFFNVSQNKTLAYRHVNITWFPAVIPKAFKTLLEVIEKEIAVISKLQKVLILKEVEM